MRIDLIVGPREHMACLRTLARCWSHDRCEISPTDFLLKILSVIHRFSITV